MQTPTLTINGPRTPSRNPSPSPSKQKGIVVFSGGSAANSLVDVFNNLSHTTCPLSYVIPISDNGGSTSELIRVFGGPGIGDLRSRLVRLIPDDGDPQSEAAAIKALFNHRLSKDSKQAKHEWQDILEAEHSVWEGVSTPKKELIRSHLNWVSLEIAKRIRPSSRFDFSSASIGNLFLTGARLFTGSLESAIYLLSSICSVPPTVSVLPAINTNFTHHISVSLTDGSTITGQNNISHPSVPTALSTTLSPSPLPSHSSSSLTVPEENIDNDIEDANLPGSLPSLRNSSLQVTKPSLSSPFPSETHLPSRISRLWYINPYGQEITLPANPRILAALSTASTVIYSIGSLFTSIIPSLILRGVGQTIATSPFLKSKILILNGSIDRETGPLNHPFTALDFVAAIANACARSRGLGEVPPVEEYGKYVTHVVYLEGSNGPTVDREGLKRAGVEGWRCFGGEGGGRGRYDEVALQQCLEMVMGRRGEGGWPRTRRNTLEG